MTRRDYNSGSIYQKCEARYGCPPLDADNNRPDHKCRGRWVGAHSAGWTERGTRRRVTVSATTEAEAKRRLRKKIQEAEAADLLSSAGGLPQVDAGLLVLRRADGSLERYTVTPVD